MHCKSPVGELRRMNVKGSEGYGYGLVSMENNECMWPTFSNELLTLWISCMGKNCHSLLSDH